MLHWVRMIVDGLIAAAVVLFGLSGARAGALRQASHWAGILGGALGAGPAAARLTPLVAHQVKLPAAALRVGLDSVFFCVIGGVTAYCVDGVLRKLVAQDGRVDKHGGFLLGAGKGAALLAAALSVGLFFEGPLTRRVPAAAPQLRDSIAVGLVRRAGILNRVSLGTAARFESLSRAARDPGALQASLAREPALAALLADPAVKSALQNDRFLRALEKGDLSEIQNDPRLAALLKDPRLASRAER